MERIIKKLARPTVSRYYEEYYSYKNETDDEVINFCLNKCPHPDKPCDGSCEEVKALAWSLHKHYRRNPTTTEIEADKSKTPLGRYLKKLRKNRKETRSIMSRKVGVCETTLYNVERGKSPIPKNFEARFLKAYKLSEEEIKDFWDSIEQTRKGATDEER